MTVHSYDHRFETNPPGPSGASEAAETASAAGSQGGLSKALKTGTAKAHRAAENVHFVRNFIKCRIDRTAFQELTARLYHVYRVMEQLLEQHRDDTVYGPLHFPELKRTAALEADLCYYLGSDWEHHPSIVQPSPCTIEYLDRMRCLAQEMPSLLLAHAYTRYLGDLSGGQILARTAKKALGLPEGQQGTAFYEFEQISSAKEFKNVYRAKLDALPCDAEMVGRLVQEANVAFLLNMRIFQELDVLTGDATSVEPLEEALMAMERPVAENGKRSTCPFGFTRDRSVVRNQGVASVQDIHSKCPFPFVLLHNPKEGVKHPTFGMFMLAVLAVVTLVHVAHQYP